MILHHFYRSFIGRAFISLFIPAFFVFANAYKAYSVSSFPPASPESQGISSADLAALSDTIQGYFENGQIVGAECLVIKNRRTVFHQAFGWMDREDKKEMGLNTIFNIRSMTKPITGAALQILIDRNEVQPGDPVSKYLPGFDTFHSREITIWQLLTHRSGLPLSILTRLDEYNSLLDIANATGEGGPQFQPDSKFWYSDAGSECVGAVAEQASNQLLDEFVQQNLLDPLLMNDTFYSIPENDPRWNRVSSAYYGETGSWSPFFKPAGKPMYPFAWGSQSLYSTPMDYAKFLAMWMDQGMSNGSQVLSSEAVQRTLTPVSVMSSLGSDAPMPSGFPGLRAYYGQMAILYMEEDNPGEPVSIGHSGSDGTWAWAWPERDLIVMYFTQSRGQITGIRLETLLDRLFVHPRYNEQIPEEFIDMLGTYQATHGGNLREEFKVSYQNNRLMLDIPSAIIFELEGPDTDGRYNFVIDKNAEFKFIRNAQDEVTGMRLYEGGYSEFLPKIADYEDETTRVEDWVMY